MNQSCVLRMDLVNSRKIAERELVQKQLMELFIHLNTEYAKELAAPITMLLGDEWSIVLKDSTKSYDMYLRIKHFLHKLNVEAYTGIGFGTINKESRDIRKMNGTAFDYALKSLRITKSNKFAYKKEIPTKSCNIFLMGLPKWYDISYDDLLNTLIQNNEILYAKMTPKQYQCFLLYDKYQSYQEIISLYPEYTKGKLSDCLNTAQYWLIQQNTKIIHQLLEQIFD